MPVTYVVTQKPKQGGWLLLLENWDRKKIATPSISLPYVKGMTVKTYSAKTKKLIMKSVLRIDRICIFRYSIIKIVTETIEKS